jgi:flagellar biosynthesis protein FlhB
MPLGETTDVEKLEELRAEGLVPYSEFTTACAGAIGVLFGVSIVINEMRGLRAVLSAVDVAQGHVAIDSLVAQMMPHLLRALVIPVLLLIVFTLLAGLLQTKFLFRPKNLALRLNRLSPGAHLSLAAYITRVLTAPPLALLLCVLGILPALIVSRDVLAPLSATPAYVPLWGSKLWISFISIICIALTALGILSWVGCRFVFLQRYSQRRPEAQPPE